jgi:hypothetical protein
MKHAELMKGVKALLSVIELHQPKSSEYFPVDVCVACSPDIDLGVAYPCRTIQAIEKELQ